MSQDNNEPTHNDHLASARWIKNKDGNGVPRFGGEASHHKSMKKIIWAIGILTLGFYLGTLTQTTVQGALTTKVIILEEIKVPPVLERIKFCESSGQHWDENGNVLRGEKNKYDLGLYQLNILYHGKKAKELGMDLYDPTDNERFAVYLFNNFGSEPWRASRKCFNQ